MKINVGKERVGIGGYDPVSYFELIQSPPYLGKKAIQVTHEQVTYYFRNQENKDKFVNEPAKYLPAYGGYCATAISEGKTAPIDPHTFLIKEGILYLFYNDILGNNTIRDWQSNEKERTFHANTHRKNNTVSFTGGGIVFSTYRLRLKNLFN